MARSIVTLTTDFGSSDPYVSVMKGVILETNPDVQLIDITHDIPPYDIAEAAQVVAQAYRYFPAWTIHLVVVDPGVGTARRPLLVTADRWHFVAPDNGVLSLVYAREQEALCVRHITASHCFREPVSNTFHGRDVFAPVVGWLSRKGEAEKFGDEITDYIKLTPPQPKRVNDRLLKGAVVRVDRFGTLITNIGEKDAPQLFVENPPAFRLIVGKTEIRQMRKTYGEGAPGEVFAVIGSSGNLEIAVNRGSAQQVVGVGAGAEVGVVLG